ncbi:liprin-beta-2 isoform X2 [Diabrotica undecimpunctata]|uniref:liprin-beta-2 isoform X2 n=1 Tax=Diabrotica undecimpunctata TaxID=50387 RepID=UPI003B633462
MRKMCKNGPVVTAAMTVFETHRLNYNNNNNACKAKEKTPIPDYRRNNSRSPTDETKNKNGCLVDEISFESAVRNFDSIAEDVQKFCSTDSLKRRGGHSIIKTDSQSDTINITQDTRDFVEDDAYGNDVIAKGGAAGSESNSDEEIRDCSASETSDSEEEKEHLIGELETITEELSGTQSGQGQEDDSSVEDDSTLKGQKNQVWSEAYSSQGSTSDLSSSSSEHQTNLRDSSTRCNSDFQWIRKQPPESPPPKMDEVEPIPSTKPPLNRPVREKTPRKDKPTTESLDRRKMHQNRAERDHKSRSHILKSPPRLDDFTGGGCQSWCCNPHEFCFDGFQRRHERLDPQRYGSNPTLERNQHQRFAERGSHPDIYGDFGRYRHEMQCCSYHMAPIVPPCCYYGERSHHWAPPPPSYTKPAETDEKFRKLQYEKDNLQLQVQVLSDQIEAQSDKISDLEKMLYERKQQLSETEDKLQREILSRSSLETQKLELMSIVSELKLQQAALERENLELRNTHYNNNTDPKKPPIIPRMSSQPALTSTPVQHGANQRLNRVSPSPSPVTIAANSSGRIDMSASFPDAHQRPKTPPANFKRQIDVHYGSLPRQQFLMNGNASGVDNNANPAANGNKKGVVFGRGFYSLVGGRHRGFSVPNLAETEKVVIEDGSVESPGSPNISFNKSKGIKKIFGKIKRSGSGNLEDIPGLSEFQRGGVRATASARLGWSEPQIVQKPDKPFSEWDTENICDWLQDLGLDSYVPEAKRWVQNGQHLQEASIGEIEKELNIKNPLHRKKLQLALIDTQANGSSDLYLSQAGKLDTAWVLRWLDDTGLPQHKENFLINRVDGRVLHRLTMDDLALLHVTSMLHVASIKRGIQVLRENNYEAGCLQRRSLPDDPDPPTFKQISLWTTHRVMEWLRAVDLAEYAPNLRGAGVHGGLMVLEPKFNADLMAALLSIPPGKTLLRRHLNTHFKELLGKDIIQEKREAESTMGYVPLTPSLKLKVTKKSQFSLKRKKSKGEADYGDLVCPLNPEKTGEMTGLNSSTGMTRMGNLEDEVVYRRVEYKPTRSLPASAGNSPIPQRLFDNN